MPDLGLVAGAKVRPVSGVANGHVQRTFEAAERIDAGQAFRLDTNGKAVKTAAGAAGTAGPEVFVAIDQARQAGNPVTGVSTALLEGFNLDALAFGAVVYLSNTSGALADAAGTVSVAVGRVTSAAYTGTPSGADKLLAVNAPK